MSVAVCSICGMRYAAPSTCARAVSWSGNASQSAACPSTRTAEMLPASIRPAYSATCTSSPASAIAASRSASASSAGMSVSSRGCWPCASTESFALAAGSRRPSFASLTSSCVPPAVVVIVAAIASGSSVRRRSPCRTCTADPSMLSVPRMDSLPASACRRTFSGSRPTRQLRCAARRSSQGCGASALICASNLNAASAMSNCADNCICRQRSPPADTCASRRRVPVCRCNTMPSMRMRDRPSRRTSTPTSSMSARRSGAKRVTYCAMSRAALRQAAMGSKGVAAADCGDAGGISTTMLPWCRLTRAISTSPCRREDRRRSASACAIVSDARPGISTFTSCSTQCG